MSVQVFFIGLHSWDSPAYVNTHEHNAHEFNPGEKLRTIKRQSSECIRRVRLHKGKKPRAQHGTREHSKVTDEIPECYAGVFIASGHIDKYKVGEYEVETDGIDTLQYGHGDIYPNRLASGKTDQ